VSPAARAPTWSCEFASRVRCEEAEAMADRGRYREPSPAQRSARPPRWPGKRAHAGLVGIGERQRRSPSSSRGLRNPASADLARFSAWGSEVPGAHPRPPVRPASRSASENRSFPSRGPPSPDAPLGRESPQARGACGQPNASRRRRGLAGRRHVGPASGARGRSDHDVDLRL